MYKILRPSKDTYITDRIIRGVRSYSANVGQAATIDIFKIYGNVTSGSFLQNELSRGLIQFDFTPIRSLFASGSISVSHPSFNCQLKMFNVNGGQTIPFNYSLALYPLSKSWDEGIGRDIVFFQDLDTANFLTASYLNGVYTVWTSSGSNLAGLLGSSDIDIISSGNIGSGVQNLFVTQSFVAGTEDLVLDITNLVSATIAGLLPDCGYRLSFIQAQETDNKTRFVKRFASRHQSNSRIAPQLLVRFDDSLINNQNNFTFDTSGSLFFYNYSNDSLSNLVSGSSLAQITGSNCLLLKLLTDVTGTKNTTYITASQHKIGSNYVTGVYSASFALPSSADPFRQKLIDSGSVSFTQIWASFDDTVGYLTSSNFVVNPQNRTTAYPIQAKYFVSSPVDDHYAPDEIATIRVYVQNNNASVLFTKFPAVNKSVTFNNMFYQVRDAITHEIIVPFDTHFNSTRCSTDSNGSYFNLDMSNLDSGRTYYIDIMINEGQTTKYTFKNTSGDFKVDEIV